MIERIVENWLIKVNERQYQFAFGQLLQSRGYRILHTSSHGPQEQGKDIITIDPDGRLAGFQLKTGNIDLAAFRKIRDELVDLVELPIQFPGVPATEQHRAILVTNGRLADTVRTAINGHNQRWKTRGFAELEVVLIHDLLKDFIDLHGTFLPTQLTDVEQLLRLYTMNGASPLPRAQFSEFLRQNLPIEETPIPIKAKRSTRGRQKRKSMSAKEIARQLASTAVLVSYALSAFEARQNHWAVFKGWIMYCAHVLAVAREQ